LQELEGKFVEDVKTVGLEPWVAKLKLRNSAMATLVAERYDESAAKNTVVVKEVRANIDKVYSAITERIYAISVVKDLIENPSDYEVFVKTMNAIVDKFETALRKKSESSQSEDVQGEG
jgi:hypothetical protein